MKVFYINQSRFIIISFLLCSFVCSLTTRGNTQKKNTKSINLLPPSRELLVYIVNPEESMEVKIIADGLVWGSRDATPPYPIDNPYYDPKDLIGTVVAWEFVDSDGGAPEDETIGRGKYAITIGTHTVKVDYSDCDYNTVGYSNMDIFLYYCVFRLIRPVIPVLSDQVIGAKRRWCVNIS